MKIYSEEDYPQGGLLWAALRGGVPTASEFDKFMTNSFELRDGKMVKSYAALKTAERWQGGPMPSFESFDMEQGVILESEARNWFELEKNESIRRVGFITTDDGKAGCSPDGLLSVGGLELKCPRVDTHVRYRLDGVLPADYICQVHGSIWVTDAPCWTFMSYARGFPQFVLTVPRDESIMQKIGATVAAFNAKLDSEWAALVKANGGKEPRHIRSMPTIKPIETKLAQAPKPSGALGRMEMLN